MHKFTSSSSMFISFSFSKLSEISMFYRIVAVEMHVLNVKFFTVNIFPSIAKCHVMYIINCDDLTNQSLFIHQKIHSCYILTTPTKSRTAERNSREKPFLGSLPLSHFSLELNDIFFVGSYTGRVFYDFFRNFLITKRVIFVTMPKSLHMAKRSSREWGYFGAV